MLGMRCHDIQHPRQAAGRGVVTLEEEGVNLVTDLKIRQSFTVFVSSSQQDAQEVKVLVLGLHSCGISGLLSLVKN